MASRLAGLVFFGLAQMTAAETESKNGMRILASGEIGTQSSRRQGDIEEKSFMMRRERDPSDLLRLDRKQAIKLADQEGIDVGKGRPGTVNTVSDEALDGEHVEGPELVTEKNVAKAFKHNKQAAKKAASRGSVKASGGIDESLLETGSNKTSKTRKARTKGVIWKNCGNTEDSPCSCAAYRRRVVIRFQRKGRGDDKQAGFSAITPAQQENWYWRQHQYGTAAYSGTPHSQINKGFKSGTVFKAHSLSACGGDKADSLDCLDEPQTCSFQEEVSCDAGDANCVNDLNIYDAKPGEYCCSAELKYCSFKCPSADVNFTCVEAVDRNFPGGMDPVGPDVEKVCYMAQYPHGAHPDIGTDAMVENEEDLINETRQGDTTYHGGGASPTAAPSPTAADGNTTADGTL